jgi:ParB-like chromosome segregation protein Spo0J
MLRYFEQLVEDANLTQEKLAYVLALYLLQRRRLRLDGSRAEGDRQLLQLSGTRGEGPWEIRDQQLSADEVARLQTELNQHLEREWTTA